MMKNVFNTVLLLFIFCSPATSQIEIYRTEPQVYKKKFDDGSIWFQGYLYKDVITETYQGKTKKEESNYKRTGPWVLFYPNGNIRSKGYYEDGAPIGVWECFYESGQIMAVGSFHQEETGKITMGIDVYPVMDKNWKFYLEDGTLHLERYYEKGKLKTEEVIEAPNYVYNFKNSSGKSAEGPAVWIYPILGKKIHTIQVMPIKQSNNIYSMENYVLNGFMRYGTWKYYHENGQVKSIGEFNRFSNKKEGKWTYYYETGEVSAIGTYDGKGNAQGTYTGYFKNGQIKYIGTLVNDKWSGLYSQYTNKGVLRFTNEYNGNEVYQKRFYNSGTLASEGKINAKSLKKTGGWKFYHYNGKYHNLMKYNNGQITEIMESFDINGKQTMTNGNGLDKSYFNNGKLSFEGTYKNGQRDGSSKWYYKNGQLTTHAIYKNNPQTVGDDYRGFRWEMVASYHENGTLRDGGTLKNGNGTWVSYDKDGKISSVSHYKGGVKL